MKSSPGSAADGVSRPSCYVCGYPNTGDRPLAIKQVPPPTPYFPFLESHEAPEGSLPPTNDGYILSCYLCYSFLEKQWMSYEREKVPPVKRLYWLKRVDNGPYTGVEMGVQSEYASQFLGFTPDPTNITSVTSNSLIAEPRRINNTSNCRQTSTVVSAPTLINDNKTAPILTSQPSPCSVNSVIPRARTSAIFPPTTVGLQQDPLDLSVESKRGEKRSLKEFVPVTAPSPQPRISLSGASRSEVLDLSMPDKDAITEVCYVCGDHHQRGTLVHISAKPTSTGPFFPSLMDHIRPSRSRPMEPTGIVQACTYCYSHLLEQWNSYETQEKRQNERHYSFRKRKSMRQERTTFVCYKCGLYKPMDTLKQVYCRENIENEPYFVQLEHLPMLSGASPISPQGLVKICDDCHSGLPNPSIQLEKKDYHKNSPEIVNGSQSLQDKPVDCSTHKASPMSLNVNLDLKTSVDIVSCYLCHQNQQIQQMRWISMTPEKDCADGAFFSFLKFLPRLRNAVIRDSSVLACSSCHQHLMSQWAEYERENTLVNLRQYSLRAMSLASHSPRLTPGPRQSPPANPQSPTVDHLQNQVFNVLSKQRNGYHGQGLTELEVPLSTTNDNLALPAITTQRPLNIAINCFNCGMHSKAGQTYVASSQTKEGDYFFPFLAKHASAHPEARIDEFRVLICHCCFHSLVLQWQTYEKQQVDHYARLYDTYNFYCYICDIKTYRKRLYQLPFKDYPFLRDHNSSPSGMVVDDGQSVVVCKDCYSSLKDQYTELEKWGVPVEKRKYNWIQRPPPPEFQQDTSSTLGNGFSSPNALRGKGALSPLSQHAGSSTRDLSLPRIGVNSKGGAQGPVSGSSILRGEMATRSGGDKKLAFPRSSVQLSSSSTSPIGFGNQIKMTSVPLLQESKKDIAGNYNSLSDSIDEPCRKLMKVSEPVNLSEVSSLQVTKVSQDEFYKNPSISEGITNKETLRIDANHCLNGSISKPSSEKSTPTNLSNHIIHSPELRSECS